MIFTYNNMNFKITNIEIEENNISYNSYSYGFHIPNKEIKIIATTDINNYNSIQDIFLNNLKTSTKTYKIDLDYKFLKIYNMFPIQIMYNNFNIEVVFTANWFESDYNILSYKQTIRKEKLKKINNICQKYS